MSEDYPRDLVGYGAKPHRPGGARIAVQFVINYEEGGENCILHGDEASEAFLSDIVGAEPWPGQRHLSMESMYEYGSRAGAWRLLRLFQERDMTATCFCVGMALERHPEPVRAMRNAGFEIASHGYRWIDYRHVDEATERQHIAQSVAAHERLLGERPLGFIKVVPAITAGGFASKRAALSTTPTATPTTCLITTAVLSRRIWSCPTPLNATICASPCPKASTHLSSSSPT